MRFKLAISFSISFSIIWAVLLIQLSCAAPRIPESGGSQGGALPAVPMIEQSPLRLQTAENSWRLLLNEYRLDPAAPNLDPTLGTPLSLPAAVAGRIRLTSRTGEIQSAEIREMLRTFISNHMTLLGGSSGDRLLTLQDLSLIGLSDEGSMYRATYRQMSFPYPLADGFGDLHLTVGRDGSLLQIQSRLLPVIDYNVRAQIDPVKTSAAFVNREFEYSGIDGRPLRYRVERSEEISVGRLVIKPVEEGGRLLLYLAYPIEVGSSLKWTVYIDAVSGREIAVRQNFNT